MFFCVIIAAMNVVQPNSYVLLVSSRMEQHLIQLKEKGAYSTKDGNITFGDIIGKEYGTFVFTHLGSKYFILKPTITDFLKFIKRKTQVLYAKDLGFIILKLNIRSGMKVIECGTGSGSATTSFAFSLYPDGKLYSYEAREEFMKLAQENLRRIGLEDVVTFKNKDIEVGFDENDVDAVFLDVKYPERYLSHAQSALKSGGNLCVFVPTTNQVSDVLKELDKHDFFLHEVVEIMLRNYKTVPERLRPDDTMIGHTGFLIFTRKIYRSLP